MKRMPLDLALWLAGSAAAIGLLAWLTPVALLLAAPWLAAVAWVAFRRGLPAQDTIASAGQQALERALRR